MTRGTRIVAIGGNAPQSKPNEPAAAAASDFTSAHDIPEVEWEDAEGVRYADAGRTLAWPVLALVAVAAWTGFVIWAWTNAPVDESAPEIWINRAAAWATPVLLLAVAWLIVMRNSLREARRFGNAARLLATESTRLESRLHAVNGELSLAREFIAAQGRDLEALGRLATERLSRNADQLRALIKDNGAQVEAIGSVSSAALENMESLRGQLPVIASSAKDVTSNIANAGRTAHTHLQELITGLRRLNDFGMASERQVTTLRGQVSEALADFGQQTEHLDAVVSARFAAFAEQADTFGQRLEEQQTAALAAIRSSSGELARELEAARERLDAHEAESLTSLRARLGAVRDESATITRSLRETEETAMNLWRAQTSELGGNVAEALQRLEAAHARSIGDARQRLAELETEAARIDQHLAERQSAFTAEIARRQAEEESRVAAAFAELEQHFSALDTGMAERQRSFTAGLARWQTEEELRAAAAIAQLEQRFAALDAGIAERSERQLADSSALASSAAAITEQIDGLTERMAEAARHGCDAQVELATSLQALADGLRDGRESLTGTDHQIAELTDAAVRLLELIQAGVQHSSHDLPTALATSEEQLATLDERILMLRDVVGEAANHGASLSNYVILSGEQLRLATADLATLHASARTEADSHGEVLASLRAEIGRLAEENRTLAEQSRTQLTGAIEDLAGRAREAAISIRDLSQDTIKVVAEEVGTETAAAVEKAMRARVLETTGELEQITTQAAEISREAAINLRDQLAKVNELAGNLERRVAHARSRAEEQ
ncbi:MAG: ATPase, partial [Novosphingobium sp.]